MNLYTQYIKRISRNYSLSSFLPLPLLLWPRLWFKMEEEFVYRPRLPCSLPLAVPPFFFYYHVLFFLFRRVGHKNFLLLHYLSRQPVIPFYSIHSTRGCCFLSTTEGAKMNQQRKRQK